MQTAGGLLAVPQLLQDSVMRIVLGHHEVGEVVQSTRKLSRFRSRGVRSAAEFNIAACCPVPALAPVGHAGVRKLNAEGVGKLLGLLDADFTLGLEPASGNR